MGKPLCSGKMNIASSRKIRLHVSFMKCAMRLFLAIVALSPAILRAASAPSSDVAVERPVPPSAIFIPEPLAEEKLGVTRKAFIASHPDCKLLSAADGLDTPDPETPGLVGPYLNKVGGTIIFLFKNDKLVGFSLSYGFSESANVKMSTEASKLFGGKYETREIVMPPATIFRWEDTGRIITLITYKVEKAGDQKPSGPTLTICHD